MSMTPDVSASSPHLPSENCCEHPCFIAAAGDDTQKMMQAQMMGMGGGLGPDAAKVSGSELFWSSIQDSKKMRLVNVERVGLDDL
jgi:hypothetical protein